MKSQRLQDLSDAHAVIHRCIILTITSAEAWRVLYATQNYIFEQIRAEVSEPQAKGMAA